MDKTDPKNWEKVIVKTDELKHWRKEAAIFRFGGEGESGIGITNERILNNPDWFQIVYKGDKQEIVRTEIDWSEVVPKWSAPNREEMFNFILGRIVDRYRLVGFEDEEGRTMTDVILPLRVVDLINHSNRCMRLDKETYIKATHAVWQREN